MAFGVYVCVCVCVCACLLSVSYAMWPCITQYFYVYMAQLLFLANEKQITMKYESSVTDSTIIVFKLGNDTQRIPKSLCVECSKVFLHNFNAVGNFKEKDLVNTDHHSSSKYI